jgi:hypothetical protein
VTEVAARLAGLVMRVGNIPAAFGLVVTGVQS